MIRHGESCLTKRIDPSFGNAADAISDLQRRLGWLREIERRTGVFKAGDSSA